MLIPEWEGLCLAEVDSLGVKVNQLRLRSSCCQCTSLGNAVEGDVSLARDVIHLLGSCLVAQHLDKGCGQILHMP